MNKPKSRTENIVVQEMNKEILIYDLKTNQAFCLNETSATIYQLCDGKNSVTEISQTLNKLLKQPITEDVVWLALNDFKKDNLLEQSEQFEINFNGLSRRQIIKKVGLASMVALPLLSAVIAPQAAQAASCGGLFQPCVGSESVGSCCAGQAYCTSTGGILGICAPCIAPSGGYCNIAGNRDYACCSGSATLSAIQCSPNAPGGPYFSRFCN